MYRASLARSIQCTHYLTFILYVQCALHNNNQFAAYEKTTKSGLVKNFNAEELLRIQRQSA